jgi:gamma-glutamyltranspeptidase
MLLTAVLDVVYYGATLSKAIAAPHISVRASDGRVEVESPLPDVFQEEEEPLTIGSGDFGPAYGITRLPDGYVGAVDGRFESGLAYA